MRPFLRSFASIKGSFMSFRRYKISPGATAKEVTELCGKEFVPIISRHPDFISYHATVSQTNEYFSVSVFTTEAGAKESVQLAASWTQKHLAKKIKLVDSVDGEVLVSADSWSKMHGQSSAD
jgi:hypothetical protein